MGLPPAAHAEDSAFERWASLAAITAARPVDPRGLLTFGMAGLGLLILAELARRRGPSRGRSPCSGSCSDSS